VPFLPMEWRSYLRSLHVFELTKSVYTPVHKGIPNEESPKGIAVTRGTWVLL
jgi:hypothetical protein